MSEVTQRVSVADQNFRRNPTGASGMESRRRLADEIAAVPAWRQEILELIAARTTAAQRPAEEESPTQQAPATPDQT